MRPRHYPILDAVRFICALVVALHHLAPPPLISKLGLESLYRIFWFGPSGVAVFFVISGFCIHLPYEEGREPKVLWFYIRRYIRIGGPLLLVLPLAYLTKMSYAPQGGWVTWSLVCEASYYLAYPALLGLSRRWGWKILIGIGFVLGAVATWFSRQQESSSILFYAKIIVGSLPLWLLGCLLAEQRSETRSTGGLAVIGWRAVAIGGSVLVAALHYHRVIHLDYTLPFLGLVIYRWLYAELAVPPKHWWLAGLGAWSYSLYLVHIVSYAMVDHLHLEHFHFFRHQPAMAWALKIGWALLFAYGFFIVVERPSHRLARSIAASRGA